MVVKRFSGSFKTRTDILDNITPNNVVQPNVSVPAGEWKPCDWLPVVWQAEASKDFFSISSGKVVSMTAEGRMCPSGLRLGTTAAGTFITYTATDVTAGVRDIRTGAALLAADVGAVTNQAALEALMARGLVNETDLLAATTSGATDPFDGSDDDLDAAAGLALFISAPVGVCAYDVYCWAGDAPGELHNTNYQKQHLVQFLTDIQMQVPVMANPTAVTNANIGGISSWSSGTGVGINFPDASPGGAALLVTNTALATLARYTGVVTGGGATGTPVIGIALDPSGVAVAQHTDRTLVTTTGFTTASALVRHRSSIEACSRAGDFFLDAEAAILFVHSADGATNPFGGTETLSFFVYSTATPVDQRMIHLNGECSPGDYVTFNANSNFAVIAVTAGTNMSNVLGRVLQKIEQPKGLLDRVRTAYSGGNFGADAQMPGTATKGFTDLITLSPETVADTVAILNIKVQ